MLSSVLRSKRAIEVNIAIMRTFVRLREMISSNKVLASLVYLVYLVPLVGLPFWPPRQTK
jgi:hypothetical protein